ncbi:MAG: SDR family oxidoreductase [Candidatus Dojkabacteria bacterium]
MQQTILVTGANRGLGLVFCRVYSESGHKVIATCREPKDATKLLELQKSSRNIEILALDITDEKSIDSLIVNLKQLGVKRIDRLINNVGVNSRTVNNNWESARYLKQLKRKTLQDSFEINATSPIILTSKLQKFLKSADSAVVVFISTQRASFNDPEPSDKPNYAYAASKVALNMFVHELAKELKPDGIIPFTVHPGSVKTDMNPNGVTSAKESAKHIIKISDNIEMGDAGKFFNYDGTLFPI